MSEKALRDLDVEAARRGVTRSELARQTLSLPKPAAGEVTLPEVLALLGEKARAGSVGAQVALLRHLAGQQQAASPPLAPARDGAGEDPLAEVDELARKRGLPAQGKKGP